MNIDELVIKAKNKDKEALLTLVLERKNELYKLAYIYTENKEDALDAMEDMIVILYQKISKLNNNDVFYSWCKTILINCCKDILRKRNNLLVLEEIDESALEQDYENHERQLDINYYLKKLNENQQEAIKLKYFMDMDYESIAKVSNVPVGTVKSRIFNGLRKLKEYIGGEY